MDHKDHDKIKIKRSDGRAHDLTAIAAFAQLSAKPPSSPPIVEFSSTAVSTDDGEGHHDARIISLTRSDGEHHDLLSFVKSTDSSELAGSNRCLDGRDVPPTPTSSGSSLRIVHLSDTRNFLVQNGKNITKFLPDGDILIHSGNFTHTGSDEDYSKFNGWLGEVSSQYPFRIVVPGSRDVKKLGSRWNEIKRRLPNATHVLCHEEALVLGIRIYGCPWFWGNKFNYSMRMGFNFAQDEGNRFGDIPTGIHILVTHGPPYYRLDAMYTVDAGKRQHVGSEELMNAIARIKPLVHLFGHCSDSRGFIPSHGRSPLFVNSTMCDRDCKVLFSCPHVIKATELFAAPTTSPTFSTASERPSMLGPFLSSGRASFSSGVSNSPPPAPTTAAGAGAGGGNGNGNGGSCASSTGAGAGAGAGAGVGPSSMSSSARFSSDSFWTFEIASYI